MNCRSRIVDTMQNGVVQYYPSLDDYIKVTPGSYVVMNTAVGVLVIVQGNSTFIPGEYWKDGKFFENPKPRKTEAERSKETKDNG